MNARDRLWEELKKITNSTDSVMGITFLKYLFKAKDYVPLKDLKDWIRKEEIKKIEKEYKDKESNKVRGIHDKRWN
tara:strand:- start:4035 stop:4262 length:228 start_codon:yes stop_codon:yes gene_type:complete